jgi:hypothetical protein
VPPLFEKAIGDSNLGFPFRSRRECCDDFTLASQHSYPNTHSPRVLEHCQRLAIPSGPLILARIDVP